MNHPNEPTPVHCYTNPSFCRQSEFIHDDRNDLPPPPQFQGDDLPPPPPPQQLQMQHHQYGQTNAAFQSQPETAAEIQMRNNHSIQERYCYLEETGPPAAATTASSSSSSTTSSSHRRYGSLPVQEQRVTYNVQSSRYEYIQDDAAERAQLQRTGSSRYEFIPHQQVLRSAPPVNQENNNGQLQLRTCRNNGARYAVVPGDQDYQENETTWNGAKVISPIRRQISTPQGRYTSLPLEEPPALPDRNISEYPASPRNNIATQKLHEILTTPRKPRSRSEERTLSPKRHHTAPQTGTPQRRAFSPGNSPSGRALSPNPRGTPHGTPQNRAFSPNGPQTSTPNKESSARRCLPLNESSSRQQDLCPASNCGKLRYVGTAPTDLVQLDQGYSISRYQYLQSGTDMTPMVSSPLKYQVVSPDQKRCGYQSVENAFIARTAVVPPLSPPTSEANTTMVSGAEKYHKNSAPLLLVLVGILTCGLAYYLSLTQGRMYYFDSAIVCGLCCALAGASRSLRKTWTGLGLAGLSALSCAGLLLLAVKGPKKGTPLHDVTAGALCGVSILGASLALLAVLRPRCSCGRHRRVHSWIPRFSP
ncbi:uncharacterized protein LOC127279530 [Leptopilina boulardi]|uniref:uncharacterized protein LOC127279530 n=1 Tax=Leptopilina boulardi TaxID=63433 RepID=UPI0021F67BBA|nr:uncharacterized protein LOC127279530 [Leptopilina boulardi]